MQIATLNKKDFQSDNEVRWCPGCGDYAILAAVQKTLAELAIDRDDTVFISGIGCAARFPYYMNTYGMHTIHGRAPAFAFGVKLANPKLKVFLITGDGDGLSIGAGHLMHLFRRNIDITVLLFNNQIYGLTKGQYSPTSQQGLVAKSTPLGAIERPINPIALALASEASFIARAIDNDTEHLSQVIKAAVLHEGTSFIEIMQNCVVFNDTAFTKIRDKSLREKYTIMLKAGQPLLFDHGQQGIAIDRNSLAPMVVDGSSGDVAHHEPGGALWPYILAGMSNPDFPLPLGIISQMVRPTYEAIKSEQEKNMGAKSDLHSLLIGNDAWQVF